MTGRSRRSQADKADRTGLREQLKERLLREGAGDLTEVQILELLLDYAGPRRDASGPAREPAERFGGLNGVFRASSSELTGTRGVAAHAAGLLRLAGDTVARCAGQVSLPAEILAHPKELERYLVAVMRAMKEENVLLILLNEQGEILG